MNFKQKWNSELQNIADQFFSKMKDAFGISFSEENLDAQIVDKFPTYGERKVFFSFLDKNYELNIRSDYEHTNLADLVYMLYIRRIYSFFEEKGIGSEFDTDLELFRMYMSKPEQQIKDHVIKVLQKGSIFCASDAYICIQWAPSLLSTDVIIQRIENGYKLISVYPGCLECNRNPDGVWYPDRYKAGDNTKMSVGANPFDFFDSFICFDREVFDEQLYSKPDYCLYAFAIAANMDCGTYIRKKNLSSSYLDYDCIGDEVNPFRIIRTQLKDLVEFKHLGKKFYVFNWNGIDNEEPYGEFRENIPVFIPSRILPKGTELFSDDEIELQIFLCGHQAVYCNPSEPELESFKFNLITSFSGERKQSRPQELHYESLEDEKETLELKKEPTEYMIRIFNEEKSYEAQLMEQSELFFEKHGVYPNIIVAHPDTFNKWFAAVEGNITDNIAVDKEYPEEDQPELFDELLMNETPVCEFVPDETGKGTVFITADYEIQLIENKDFQEGVYEILNGYSPQLESNCFMFPVLDAEATGKKIREIMNEKGITPLMLQKVFGGISLQGIYKWFNGQSLPQLDKFAVLSNILNIPIDDLIVVQNQKREKFN